MTTPQSDAGAMRKRHLKFLAALLVVTALCWLSMPREHEPELPSIRVGSVSYGQIDERPLNNRSILASYTITNTGSRAFAFTPKRADYIRFETSNGWETIDLIFEKAGRSSLSQPAWTPYQFFLPGSVVTGATSLPTAAHRWQVGYEVYVASPREDLEGKLGARWSKPAIALLGDSLSECGGRSIIWGPIVDLTAADKALIKSLEQPR